VGLSLEMADLDMMGVARKISINKDNTTIVAGGETAEEVKKRIGQIRKQLDESDSDYDKEKLQERIAKLAGGVAVIKVGAATETELKDRKLRIEDALNATKAAVEEGIVPGGGTTLIHLSNKVDESKADLNEEEKIGANIVKRALEEPLNQIANNSGVEGSVVVEKVRSTEFSVGYNVITCQYEDMIVAGIVDPAMVIRSALQNAGSIAGMVLTTEAVVVEKPEKKAAGPDMDGGMGGMGGMGMPGMGMM
ncbi:MAG: molecular chaperone GroEL, partial [Trichodesmium sp. St15_bin1_1]|nr:molecular chaperone GroEL [Trichodesmium sp. St15_bin1_1]